MQNSNKIGAFIAGLLLFHFQVASQTHDIKFRLVPGANGISLGKITSITQDKNGVMWFSDQDNRCIVRYDGNYMTRYTHDPKNPNSLGGTYPEYLYTDSTGIIWIGFFGMGLDRFDPVLGTFEHFRHDPADPSSLANDSVTAILVDSRGVMWIGNNGGLDRFDPVTKKFSHHRHQNDDPNSLSCNVVRTIYEDSEGTIWVGTGLPWNLNDCGGLNRLNRKTGTFTRFMHDPDDPNSLVNNKVRSILEDSQGNLWVGTMGDGLHTYDRKSGKIKRHPIEKAEPGELARPEVNSLYDHITFMREDVTGHIWVGTLSNGLLRYDPETGESDHYSSRSNPSSGFTDDSGWWAYTSSDGLCWVSTQEGNLFQVELFTNDFLHHDLDSLVVIDMMEDTGDFIWFGTSGGLIGRNLKSGSIKRFQHSPADPESLSDNLVISLAKDDRGTFWIGTQNGLNRFDPVSGKFTRYINDPDDYESLSHNDISCVLLDPDKSIWVGTWGMGLNRLDSSTGRVKRYLNDPEDTTSINDNGILAMFLDEAGDLWCGNANWENSLSSGGISRLNRKNGVFTRYLPGKHVSHILKDSRGVIWAGADEGLFYFDEASDSFFSVRRNNPGLDVFNINSMAEDIHRNLWILAEDGIYRINKDRDRLIRFGRENNLNIERLIQKVLPLRSGDLLFGSMYGYYQVNNDNLQIPVAVPRIYYKDFWLNGKPVKPGAGSFLTDPFNDMAELELNHDENVFSIDLSVIHYGLPGSVSNYFKLENYDPDWQPLTTSNQVHYFNVPPGKYEFRFRSINKNNGIPVERSTTIYVAKPWWVTWWAYCLYGLVLVGGMFGMDRIQRKRVLEKERAIAKEIELKQAREIEKAYRELKATQSQLIQSEKMASLGELTAGIAHEIQNPLNFVNNFSEVNKELLGELRLAIDNKDQKEIEAILNNLDENEGKVINHGKRAEGIVKSMLQHSRSGAGQKESTDINALCDEYLRLAYHGMRAKNKSFNAKFKLELDPDLPKIKVVPQDIGRVLLNLINNAFQASSSEALAKENRTSEPSAKEDHSLSGLTTRNNYIPEVTVSTTAVPLSGGARDEFKAVQITVKDNGPGIPEQIRDKIFQPFFTTKPTGQGTGLGLSLSYDIVKAHGGELTVENTEGEGAEFIITLPLRQK